MTRLAIAGTLATTSRTFAGRRGTAGAQGQRARSGVIAAALLGLLALMAQAHAPHSLAANKAPRLSAYNSTRLSTTCEGMTVHGFYFVPGSVTLTATQKGATLTVSPNMFTASATDGNFVGTISICGIVFGSPQANVFLVGTGADSVASNQVNVVLN
jgi:hypothetical protein